jgi:phosphoglycolate phosphatase-like HAD superfamily hydrolase
MSSDERVPPPEAEHLSVLLDVDGVLYPLPELFTPFAAERLGRELELDTTNWEFYTEWGLGYDDFVELLGEGVRERRLWWSGAPYSDVAPAVARIRAAGHEIHVVTARDVSGIEAEAFDATEHWLARHGLEVDTINLAQDKTVVVERLGLDPRSCIAIDDGPHYIASFNAIGVYGLVLDRWGSYRGEHPSAPDLTAVADVLHGWRRPS